MHAVSVNVPLSFEVFAILFGLAFGSFGNVLVYRLPLGKSLWGRSKCPSCRRKLTAMELIPVLSFLFLKGKCRSCKKRLSWQYPLVELASAGVFLFALEYQFPSIPSA